MNRAGTRIRMAVWAAFFAAGGGAAFAQSAGQVFQQGGTPDFVVSMEAESHRTNTPGTGSTPHTWNLATTPTGFTGTGYMQSTPDSGQNVNTGYTDPASGSCRLDFKVNFTQTGAHYIWVRGRAIAGVVGSSDSCHVGLNWQATSDSDRVNSFSDAWTWRRITMDGNDATFSVPAAGVHTVNVWMREDGFRFDNILLTTNASYAGVTDGGTMAGPAQSGTIATPPPVIVSPTSLGNGATGAPYQVNFQATGAGPFTWSTTGTLPPGLSLNPTSGVYSGTPTTVNTYTFTVTVTASEGGSTTSPTYTHVIDPGATGPPFITAPPSPLPDGEEGSPYSQIISAAGAALITWGLAPASNPLPPGMTLDIFGGNYAGTPGTAGTYTFTVRATNSQGFNDRTYTHKINPPPSFPPTSISPTTLLDWDQGTMFSITFTASGSTPRTWSSSGTLPSGMTLTAATGDFSGMPSPAGTYSFIITAENAGGSFSQSYTWNILPPAGTAPTITAPATPLPPGTVGQPFQVQFTASGSATITWSNGAGIPAGMMLDTNTGLYSGTPTTPGTATFSVTADNTVGPGDTRTYTHVINAATAGAPAITGPATPLPAGMVAAAYSTRFTATGTTPITWSVTSGSPPPGISLNGSTGDYAGTPTAGGTYTFTVTASNGTLPNASQACSHTVNAPTSGPAAITGPASPLPAGTVGTPYSNGFTATGSTPLTWRVVLGSLPTGLSLNPGTGAYLGTPSAAGTFTFTVGVDNTAGPEATALYSHTIGGGPPTAPTITTTPPLPGATQGVPYSVTFAASGSTPITWSMSAPVPGLTLNTSTGLLDGTPSATGTFPFDVTASNGVLPNDTNPFSLTIAAAPAAPIITGPTSPLPNGTEGTAYPSTNFTATGAATITWSITGGAQPPGLALSTAGVYSGTSTAAGAYTFTVTATNGVPPDASANYQHTIVLPATPPVITGPASPLSPGTVGSAYSAAFVASGTTPITWGFTGTLPTGMSLNSSTGAYTGAPSATGTFNFTITATNSAGTDSDPYQHVINPATAGPPAITGPASLAAGTEGTPYSANFTASGTAPITWSVVAGALPPGLLLDSATGAYTGTPTTPGTYTFTVQASNALPPDATAAHSHTINPPGGPPVGGGGGGGGGCGLTGTEALALLWLLWRARRRRSLAGV